ncbi:hypothetical protein KY284_034595 [Solanum tuberosum]|nr:hypothetical protein KY284_034595 [Solanum tuberosum]
MSSIAILVMHSGKWDDANCNVDYVIEGVVFRENASFTELYNIIATQLAVHVPVKKLTVAEIVNPLDNFQMENCSVVIIDPSHKYVKVDQVYNNKATLKCVMEQYAIAERFQFKTKRSNSIRKYTPADIKKDMKLDLGVDITYMLAWKAKERALISLRDTPGGSCSKLPEYLYILGITYPGSHIRLQKTDEDRLIKIVEKVDIRVKEYLELAGYDKWSRIYAPVHRGWSMTSNIAESINAALVSARELPIYDFLEEVRLMFGRWNCDNKKEASFTFTPLIGKFQEILKINEAMSTRLMVFPSTEYVHNVNDKG